jgi:hypothetical protein
MHGDLLGTGRIVLRALATRVRAKLTGAIAEQVHMNTYQPFASTTYSFMRKSLAANA